MATTARQDIKRQRTIDSNRDGLPAMFFARVKAVLEAQDAVARREAGAVPALRQGYIDIAAAAELLADDLSDEVKAEAP